jgi:lysozyme
MENETKNTETLLEMLKRHEGLRLFPYNCSAGKTTIGYGRNLTDMGISESEAQILLVHDMEQSMLTVDRIFPDFYGYSRNRKKALTDMMFNLGLTRFLKFRKMIDAILNNNWPLAAEEAEDSLWFSQVKSRGIEIVKLIREG